MWIDLVRTPLFGVGLTLLVFFLAQRLYQKSGSILFNPVAVAIAAIIALLQVSGISYQDYSRGGDLLLFLLGPSVVALGLPLYQRRREILARKLPILAGVTVGALTSIVTASGLAWLLGGSREVIWSFAPKSVTTPIAIGIAEKVGGLPPLTAAIVVITGCVGAICGPEFCRLIGLRHQAAIGLAVGTSAHGIGTARMLEVDRLGGAVAGLAIGLNGLITAFLVPLVYLLFH